MASGCGCGVSVAGGNGVARGDRLSSPRNKLRGLMRSRKPCLAEFDWSWATEGVGLAIIRSVRIAWFWFSGGALEMSSAVLKTGSAGSFTISSSVRDDGATVGMRAAEFEARTAIRAGFVGVSAILGVVGLRTKLVGNAFGRVRLAFVRTGVLVTVERGAGWSSCSSWRTTLPTASASAGGGLSARYSRYF